MPYDRWEELSNGEEDPLAKLQKPDLGVLLANLGAIKDASEAPIPTDPNIRSAGIQTGSLGTDRGVREFKSPGLSPEVRDFVSRPPPEPKPVESGLSADVKDYVQKRPLSEDEKMFVSQLADRSAAQGQDAQNNLYAALGTLSGGRVKQPAHAPEASFEAQAKAAGEESRKRAVEESDLKGKGLAAEKLGRENTRAAKSEAEKDDPNSAVSKERQKEMADLTGRPVEEFAGIPASRLDESMQARAFVAGLNNKTKLKVGEEKNASTEKVSGGKNSTAITVGAGHDQAKITAAGMTGGVKNQKYADDKATKTDYGQDYELDAGAPAQSAQAKTQTQNVLNGHDRQAIALKHAIDDLTPDGHLPVDRQARAKFGAHFADALQASMQMNNIKRWPQKQELELLNKQYGGNPDNIINGLLERTGFKNEKELLQAALSDAAESKQLAMRTARVHPVVKPVPAASKPKTVIQNGHTYTLNPETGQYE